MAGNKEMGGHEVPVQTGEDTGSRAEEMELARVEKVYRFVL